MEKNDRITHIYLEDFATSRKFDIFRKYNSFVGGGIVLVNTTNVNTIQVRIKKIKKNDDNNNGVILLLRRNSL